MHKSALMNVQSGPFSPSVFAELMNFSAAQGRRQDGIKSAIPNDVRDTAISILKRPDVLNSILILIGDENLLPKEMPISQPEETLRIVQSELRGLKKLSQMLIRPFKTHNLAAISVVWTFIGIFLMYALMLARHHSCQPPVTPSCIYAADKPGRFATAMFVCYAILETFFIFFLVLITGCIVSVNPALFTCVCSRLLQYPARHVRIMAKKRVITVSFLLQVTPPSHHRICPFFTFLTAVCLSGLVCNCRRFRRTVSPAEPGLQHQVACSCVRSSLRVLTPVCAASYHLPESHNTPSASRFLCLTTPHKSSILSP